MIEPENIILGCVKIADGIALTEVADEAYVRAGRDVTIRLPYEYRHYGFQWDGYLVSIRTTLDGEIREAEARDHRHAANQGDLFAFLEAKYGPLTPGEHELSYEIMACFKHGPHGRPEKDEQEEIRKAGTIKIKVAPMVIA